MVPEPVVHRQRPWGMALAVANESAKKSPAVAGLSGMEAEVGIEPAYADLQSAA
jgi:hypothetical protein